MGETTKRQLDAYVGAFVKHWTRNDLQVAEAELSNGERSVAVMIC